MDKNIRQIYALIKKLQESHIGDLNRLSAIQNAIDNNRKIYESDMQYIEKLNLELNKNSIPCKDNRRSDTNVLTHEFSITVDSIESIKRARIGDPKYLDMISKKLTKGKELVNREREYLHNKLLEYRDLEKKENASQIEQIKQMQEKKIGDDERLGKLQKILENGDHMADDDRVYFAAKYKEMTQIIVTKTMNVEGYKITAYLGIVTGLSALGMNVISDIFTGLRDFFGGRSGTYEKYFKRAREDAMRDMLAEAESVGANAIVGVSIDLIPIASQGKSMVMVGLQGTAVLIEKS